MIKSLLIANRGEIACRIIRTARAMGIRTIAVYSDADAKALHVRQADEAVHIGPSPAAESYLVGAKIIAAAKETGAEAVHPGYGFLSENADFAQSVIDAGLIWVGPKPDSIRAMGLKDAAKTLMAEAGVPVTPGYLGEDQSAGRLAAEADRIGYPVLIKAVAGGGGKGMRKVEKAADFAADLASCQREAKASFGNDIVLLEKWVTSPRHIEVQVFGDSHGNVVHLFERDCSLQRRHQKVIEEAPAPGMDEATREAICAAAVRAAKAVDYEGAGTIEFIADASEGLRADRIWFMEMNTRLQVEHPVTEEITGVDLVEWQLRVASGEPLPKRQEELSINGHAIEARLYAEDPAKGFLPSIGTLDLFDFESPEGFRAEMGVGLGSTISPNYDPMIGKLIAHGDDRQSAVDLLVEVIDTLEIWPVKSNATFLNFCLRNPRFEDAELSTGFIEQELGKVEIPTETPDFVWSRAAELLFDERLSGIAPAFRSNSAECGKIWLSDGGTRALVDLDDPVDREFDCWRINDDGSVFLTLQGQTWRIGIPRSDEFTGQASAADGDIISPMPGKVIAVDVAEGDTVAAGQRLMVLEAMKMEHALTAPFDGVVAELSASEGAQVQVEAVLARIEKVENDD